MEKTNRNIVATCIAWVVGTAAAYLFGTIWFVYLMHCSVMYALTICVFPFIIGDIVKIIVGTILGKEVRKALSKAGIIGVARA